MGAFAMNSAKYSSDRRVSAPVTALIYAFMTVVFAAPANAAGNINGQVLGAGAPIANSTVTLWAASAGAPKQLAQTRTGADGRFAVSVAVALIAVLGSKFPANVTVNEMTTVASVWTHAQFLTGTAIQGHALGLRIAAGNVPNFVDLATGGWGEAIQSPLNGGQTPTMANFATLADVLAGCVNRVTTEA